LLFIHHSCGGQWLAPVGPDSHQACVYESAHNGGGLRDRLLEAGYEVHEASYGSLIGENTDLLDWPNKFRDQMQEIITCDQQDSFYGDSRRNDIVVFKSCFHNNLFDGRGENGRAPGGARLTVESAKAAYVALLDEFAAHPQTLFVAVTAPPLSPGETRRHREVARRLLGRSRVRPSGPYAREFNHWLADSEAGWLDSYSGSNVAVFDLYDLLTDGGLSDFSRYPSGARRDDSHPSSEGNKKATEAFIPVLNRAVERAGLAPALERRRQSECHATDEVSGTLDMNVRERIRGFLAENFLLSTGDFPLPDDASLLEEGVVDSTGILELVSFLEEAFTIAVADEEIVPENFDSVDRLVVYVEGKQH